MEVKKCPAQIGLLFTQKCPAQIGLLFTHKCPVTDSHGVVVMSNSEDYDGGHLKKEASGVAFICAGHF